MTCAVSETQLLEPGNENDASPCFLILKDKESGILSGSSGTSIN